MRALIASLAIAGAAAFAPAAACVGRRGVVVAEVKGPMSGGFQFPWDKEPDNADEAQAWWEAKWAQERADRNDRVAISAALAR